MLLVTSLFRKMSYCMLKSVAFSTEAFLCCWLKITEFFLRKREEKIWEPKKLSFHCTVQKTFDSWIHALKRAWRPISLASKGHCSFFSEYQGDTVTDELSSNSFSPGNLKNSSAWSFQIKVGLLRAETYVNRSQTCKNLINFRNWPWTEKGNFLLGSNKVLCMCVYI